MQAIANARYIRLSPRKVDQIFMLIRGKSVSSAMMMLRVVTKRSRPFVENLLKSAFANAGKNQNPEAWTVSQAWVGQGPVLKRMRAHAMGRGSTIRHRTAHATIVLKSQDAPRVKPQAAPAAAKASKKGK